MPESTIAIVAAGAPLYLSTPVTYAHFSFVSADEFEESRTRASSVTALTCLSAASARTCAPFRSTATPSIDRKFLTFFLATPRTSATALAAWLPALPWTMTLNVPAGFACTDDSSEGVTYALRSCFDGLAAAPKGTSTTSAKVANSAERRLPLPQSAFEREPSPRLPLPQSALARTPRRCSPFLIPLLSRPQLTSSNVGRRLPGFLTLLRYTRESSPVRVTSRARIPSLVSCACLFRLPPRSRSRAPRAGSRVSPEPD